MEVLFVSHKFPPSVGGMEKQSYELVTGMQDLATVHSIVYDGSSSIISFFLGVKKRILAALKEHPNIELIHFNDGLMAAVCVHHKGYEHVKRVVTVHGLDVTFPLPFYQKQILPKFNRFDKIIAVSNATAEVCLAKGIQPSKLAVVLNGVDSELPTVTDDSFKDELHQVYGLDVTNKKILVSVGRPVKRKGFSWFIENVIPHLPADVLYLIAGPINTKSTIAGRLKKLLPFSFRHRLDLFFGYASDTELLNRLLDDARYKHRTFHLGKIPNHHLVRLFKTADIFVMPNISVEGDMEGFGLVCLEAGVCGALVVASRVDGIADAIIDGRNGLLVEAGNSRAWINLLTKLLTLDEDDRKRQAKGFADFTISHYQWDRMVQGYFDVFHEVIGSKSK